MFRCCALAMVVVLVSWGRVAAEGGDAATPTRTLAVAETIDNPLWRVKAYVDTCDALPADQRQQKLKWLSEALVYARSVETPPLRAVTLGLVGERLLDLGETRTATDVLREGQTLARELPAVGFGGYARGAFAEELAQIDLEAALELVSGLKDEYEFNRHHGNIAHELGARRPEQAERVLKLLRTPRDQYAVRVCYRMAPADLQRARRIADAADTAHQRAFIYGTMAGALAETNKPVARELLEDAFALLETTVESGEDRFNYVYSASTIAARLLPVAEQIDPALVPEFLWRTVSFRLFPDKNEGAAQLADQSNAILAVLLARYDRNAARAVLSPLGPSGDNRDPWLRAIALVDPERAVAHVEQMDESDDGFRRFKAAARIRVAQTLALEGDQLWRAAAEDTALWVADTEDL